MSSAHFLLPRLAVTLLAAVVVALCPLTAYALPQLEFVREYRQPEPAVDDYFFGTAVGVSDDYVGVLGYQYENSRSTQHDAFIFDSRTGEPLWTLSQPVPDDNLSFRFESIAIDGDLAVVGASAVDVPLGGGPVGGDTVAYDAGAAYVYDLTTGQLLHRFVSDTPLGNRLGSDVDIAGDVAVVGGFGRAYAFNARTGAQLAELIPSEPSSRFGISVGISESAIVAGSNSDASRGEFTGAVFTFDPQTFQQTAKFVPDSAVEFDSFGVHTDVSGDVAIASGHAGAIVFDAHTGKELGAFDLATNLSNESVAIDGGVAVLGTARGRVAGAFDWATETRLVGVPGTPASLMGGSDVAIDGDTIVVVSGGLAVQYRLVPEPASALLALAGAAAWPGRRERVGP